ncbi:MAG TPA: sulfite exporter TauE/SafE family protein, partial [Gammaproteobacteria bacterium]|nr:sulfite exporter TauE/SafE family protein [Gammaproteobacteria bacterium]
VPFAVALMPVPILLANVWQAFYGGHLLSAVRRFWTLILALVIGTVVGAQILVSVDSRTLYAVVGGIVVVFSLSGYLQPASRLPPRSERWLSAIVGFVSGVLGGLSTMFGPPLIMFLIALRLPKDEFVGTIAVLYLFGIVPLTLALGALEVMGARELLLSALASVPLFLGVLAGQLLRSRLDQETFRKGLLVTLLLTGAALIRRAIAG